MILRTKETSVQKPAKQPTDMMIDEGKVNRLKMFIPLVLIIVVLGTLFSFTDSSSSPSGKTKAIYALDSAGASGGSGASCVSQQVADELEAMGLGTAFLFRNWDWFQYVNYGVCPPRPVNPSISLSCINPQITVALMIDRSSSVIKDGSETTPSQYKQQLKTLIDEFYLRFTPSPRNGTINFLLYAFGSKSVMQNDTTNGLAPVLASNVITDASTQAGKDAMIEAINQIHFRNEETTTFFNKRNPDLPGFQRKDNTPYQRQRAYNYGSETAYGEYGKTNWHGALLDVMEAASNPFYNNPGPSGIGKRIDLAVMITDGLPTADNGWDWSWAPGTFRGDAGNVSYNPAVDGIDFSNADSVKSWNEKANNSDNLYHDWNDDLYRITTTREGKHLATQAVDYLRSGANPRTQIGSNLVKNIPVRPPISVKGIIVTTNSDASVRNASKNYASTVFGEGNYFFATDFTSTLKTEIQSLVSNVIDESGCPSLNDPVTPLLTVNVDKSQVTPMEGTSEIIHLSVTNHTVNAALHNIEIYNCGTNTPLTFEDVKNVCSLVANVGSLASGATSSQYEYLINVVLGQPSSNLNFVAIGEPSLGVNQTLTSGVSPSFAPVAVDPQRASLPA